MCVCSVCLTTKRSDANPLVPSNTTSFLLFTFNHCHITHHYILSTSPSPALFNEIVTLLCRPTDQPLPPLIATAKRVQPVQPAPSTTPTPFDFFLRRQLQTGLQARMQGYYQQPQMQMGQQGGYQMDPRMQMQAGGGQMMPQMMGGQQGMMGGMHPMMGGMGPGMGQAWRQLVRDQE